MSVSCANARMSDPYGSVVLFGWSEADSGWVRGIPYGRRAAAARPPRAPRRPRTDTPDTGIRTPHLGTYRRPPQPPTRLAVALPHQASPRLSTLNRLPTVLSSG